MMLKVNDYNALRWSNSELESDFTSLSQSYCDHLSDGFRLTVAGDKSAFEREHATRVRDMFAGISARYDLLNHLLSLNVDKQWRRRVVKALGRLPAEAKVLDVACGTGDLALTIFELTGAQVVGIDFCRPMLEIAVNKAARRLRRIPFIEGDALQLP